MRFFRHFHPRHMKHPSLVFLWRVIKSGAINWWRNKPLAIATTLIIALIFFVFNLMLALNLAADSVLLSVGKKIDIRVEIQKEVEDYTKQNLVRELKTLPGAADVIFVSKEDALQRMGSKYPNILTFLDRNKLQNPLPDVIRIVARRIEDNAAIIAFLEKPEYAKIIAQEKLKSDPEEQNRQEKILNVTHFLKRMGGALNITFALVVILIIFNSINLNVHAHRKEIMIMQLVGARLRFIRGGALFEGVLYAVSGLFISLLLSRLTVMYLTRNLLGLITNENLLMGLNAILIHFGDYFWLTLLWQGVAAIAVGLLSSFLAIEIYLKKSIV
ncbi:hypothetical protein HZA43_00350 [Candidatus Peregrinibacteria bacterium]|nr:hypothetical protein [Candidatus Peregrinibacteria bacterium]